MQNPALFRIMTYLEPEAYSEHCQAFMMERSAKVDQKIKKKFFYFLIFLEMKLSCSNIKKFLIFQETELPYISGEVYLEVWYVHNPRIIIFLEIKVSSLIFQKGTFQARKIEKNSLQKKVLIFPINGAF